jgi:hypothetical protein
VVGGAVSQCDDNGCSFTPFGPLEVRISHG